MAAITTRNGAYGRLAEGKGGVLTYLSGGLASSTGATAGSGGINVKPMFNSVGTTYPTTLVSLPKPNATECHLVYSTISNVASSAQTATCYWLGYFYKLGTVNLAATGNQFTEDTAVGPYLRTVMGQASSPITLLPIIFMTTATTTTAPQLYLRNATGPGNGYYDQDGNYTTGDQLFTFPSATTSNATSLVPMMNAGDSGVRRITHIDVTVAAAAGAATIFGFEPMTAFQTLPYFGQNDAVDTLHNLDFPEIGPASPTSGTATSYLGLMAIGASSTASTTGTFTYINNG